MEAANHTSEPGTALRRPETKGQKGREKSSRREEIDTAPVSGAENTRGFGIFVRASETLETRRNAWWAREDSNLQPDRYEQYASNRSCDGVNQERNPHSSLSAFEPSLGAAKLGYRQIATRDWRRKLRRCKPRIRYLPRQRRGDVALTCGIVAHSTKRPETAENGDTGWLGRQDSNLEMRLCEYPLRGWAVAKFLTRQRVFACAEQFVKSTHRPVGSGGCTGMLSQLIEFCPTPPPQPGRWHIGSAGERGQGSPAMCYLRNASGKVRAFASPARPDRRNR